MTNRGAHLLRKSGAALEGIAKVCGVSTTAAGYWRAGSRKPRLEVRERLAEAYGVPVEAWDEPDPVEAAAPPVPPSSPAPAPAPVAAPELEPVPAGVQAKAEWLERRVHELMARVGSDMMALPIEQGRVLASCAQTLHLLAKVTGALDLSPARIIRSAPWREVEAALASGLAKHPAAAADVAAALRALHDSNGQARH